MTTAALRHPANAVAHAAKPGVGGDVPTATDEWLAARVREGSREAFEELDRRLRPRLLAALRRRLRSRDDCEDVAQQALFTAYRQIHRYDPAWRVTTWVFTIAFRLAIDLQRRERSAAATSAAAAADAAFTDSGREPWRAAADAELRDNLWAAADRALDDTAYTLLWLRFGEGLEPAEIAKVLGKTTVHVRVLQHRAIKRLRTHLRDTDLGSEISHA